MISQHDNTTQNCRPLGKCWSDFVFLTMCLRAFTVLTEDVIWMNNCERIIRMCCASNLHKDQREPILLLFFHASFISSVLPRSTRSYLRQSVSYPPDARIFPSLVHICLLSVVLFCSSRLYLYYIPASQTCGARGEERKMMKNDRADMHRAHILLALASISLC